MTKKKDEMGLFVQNMSALDLYLRNQYMLGVSKKVLPKSVIINNEVVRISEMGLEDVPMFDIKGGTPHPIEAVAAYMLYNLQIVVGADKTAAGEKAAAGRNTITLYGAIQAKMDVYDWLHDILWNKPEVFIQLVPLMPKGSPNGKVGIVGNYLYAPLSKMKTDLQTIFDQSLDLIFGKDKLGKFVDSVMGETRCPNMLDILTPARFSQLLDLAGSQVFKGYVPSNIRNYFYARGYTYIDQTPFIKKGVYCGCANVSYVAQTSAGIADPVLRKTILAEVAQTMSRDMVVIGGAKFPVEESALAYFTPSGLEKFLSANNFEIKTIKPRELAKFCGINYVIGGK